MQDVAVAPSQRAAHGPVPAQAARVPRGEPVTVVQVPGTTSQAWHWPVHPERQHTPSTQKPVPQSVPLVQVCPSFFLQVPSDPK